MTSTAPAAVALLLVGALMAVLVGGTPQPGHAATTQTHDGEPLTWAVENEGLARPYTQQTAVEHAERFSVITALRDSYRAHVAAMKQANPDLTLFVYLNGAMAQAGQGAAYPESWYLRDQHGNKIRNNWDLWLMDPAAAGWRDDRVRTCQEFLAHSGYDGCMLDNLGAGTLWPASLTAHPVNPATGAAYTHGDWLDATSALAGAVRDAIVPAPVLANGLVSGQEYFREEAPSRRLLGHADYGLAETFVRPAWQPPTDYRPEAAWRADVDMLVDAAARGRPLLVLTKLWVDATAAQRQHILRYALATFLLGDDGTHRFAFQGAYRTDVHASVLDTALALGPARGAYAAVDGVYQRRFANGRVLVNPTATARRVTLDEPVTDLDGATHRDHVDVPAHTGLIVRVADGEPAPVPDGTAPHAPCTAYFGDIAGNVHADAIRCAAAAQVTSGVAPYRYGPAAPVRRDQMASFVARVLEASGGHLPAPSPQGFTDLAGNTHADRINQLAGAGVVRGITPASFAPGQRVSRAQMATFLARAYEHRTGQPLPSGPRAFADVAGNPHADAIDRVAAAGYTAGVRPGMFAPAAPVRRDQMASFVMRLLDHLDTVDAAAQP